MSANSVQFLIKHCIDCINVTNLLILKIVIFIKSMEIDALEYWWRHSIPLLIHAMRNDYCSSLTEATVDFKLVKGKCQVTYSENLRSLEEYFSGGLDRFYFTEVRFCFEESFPKSINLLYKKKTKKQLLFFIWYTVKIVKYIKCGSTW